MSKEISEFPTLLKETADGGVQTWSVRVDQNDDGTATIIVTHGRVGGKLQEARRHIKTGKNLGKKNATTPLQQAYKEAAAEHTEQLERNCYGFTVEQSRAARAASPMLAQGYDKHGRKVNWATDCFEQPKLDGLRVMAICTQDGVFLRSRKGVFYELPHLVDVYKQLLRPGQVLDGELYAHGLSVNKISSLATRPRSDSEVLRHHLYDMKPTEAAEVAFRERYLMLKQKLEAMSSDSLVLVPTQRVHNEDELMALQAQHIEDGYEGSMLRHGETGYENGKRSYSLLKVKTFQDAEFKITGVRAGQGSHADMAVFECVTDAGHEFEVTAPGTHEEKRVYLANGSQYIGRQLTVKFARFTDTEKPVPFHPVAKAIVAG